jgi:hypothetical protein
MLERSPIDAWTGGLARHSSRSERRRGGVPYFAYSDRMFRTTMPVSGDAVAGLQELVRELAEWRLTEYLDRAKRQSSGAYTLKVSHASGKPILFLPSGDERADLPTGWTDLRIDGAAYSANFVKVALNVVRRADQPEGENELPRILRGWFGPDAGAPGTRHAVELEQKDDGAWELRPIGRREGQLQLWRAYAREEIPPLFGLEFSTAIWNVGYVRRNGHIFLLTTLDKAGHGSEFQYKDHFVSPTEFEWQSQKPRPARGAKSPSASAWGWGPTRIERSTAQASADGQDIRHHAQRDIPVHLFVRAQKKLPGGGAAPFVYCGDVTFVSWHGDRPITVRWRLPEAVPERLRGELRVPG